RRRSISTREDVLVEVQTPDEVLVLPRLAQTRELHVHGAVVLEEVVALAEEAGELLDADVLAHLELGDLVELGARHVAVVHAHDARLVLGDAGAAEGVVTPGGLVLGDGEASDVGAVVDRREARKGAPAAADVEHGLALLE